MSSTFDGAVGSLPSTRPYQWRGLGVALAGLVVTGAAAGVVHAFARPGGTWPGELVAESVAAALGYVVAFGLGWWRPRRSASASTTAGWTALVLAVLGALLLPVCFWNPMPLTFAASAWLLLRWGRAADDGRDAEARTRPVTRVVPALAVAVVVVQVAALAVHVAAMSAK
jgi:hypothetical protein